MRKVSVKIGSICIAAATAVSCLGITMGALADSTVIKSIDSSNRTALLGVANPDDYFLGIASQFSVFVEGDFAAEGSDCEGRLGAGGNANMGEISYDYSVGAKLEDGSPAAHVVVGGNTLQKFQPNGKNFVVGEAVNVDAGILNYASLGQCNVYEGELINFAREFDLLRTRSRLLASMNDNATLEIDPNYAAGWTVRGSDPELNVLTLTADQVEEFNEVYVQFSIYIPEGSYLVINVEGDAHVDMPGNEVHFYNEDGSARIVDETQIPVLYNLADATSFHYMGSLFGSTLAPNADGTGDEGGHIAGATFAKSFKGGIEFGYTFFNMGNITLSAEETTTATASTTAAAETTATSTAVSAESDVNTTTLDDSNITDNNSTSTTNAPATDTTTTTNTTTTAATTTTATTAATTTTGTGTTGSSPATGDPLKGGVLAAASAALLGMTLLRKRK